MGRLGQGGGVMGGGGCARCGPGGRPAFVGDDSECRTCSTLLRRANSRANRTLAHPQAACLRPPLPGVRVRQVVRPVVAGLPRQAVARRATATLPPAVAQPRIGPAPARGDTRPRRFRRAGRRLRGQARRGPARGRRPCAAPGDPNARPVRRPAPTRPAVATRLPTTDPTVALNPAGSPRPGPSGRPRPRRAARPGPGRVDRRPPRPSRLLSVRLRPRGRPGRRDQHRLGPHP